MESNKKINIAFSVARVFAVISIISAHVNISSPKWADKMVSAIGSIGVIVFIILSGYFYRPEKYQNVFRMLLEKTKTVGIPWVVMGSLSFVSGAIVTDSFSIVRWITYLLGYQSFLYYLPVLMICYIVFYRQSKIGYMICGAMTVISVYATALGLLDGVTATLHLTNYLNIFNWIGYFGLGCYLRSVDKDKLYRFLRRSTVFSVPAFIVMYVLICIFQIKTGYFSYIGMPYQLVAALAIAGVSTAACLDHKVIHTVSNMTFTIYLVHMPLIGLIDVIFKLNIVTKLLAPLIILLSTVILLYIGYLCARLIKLEKLYGILTGMRIDRDIKNK